MPQQEMFIDIVVKRRSLFGCLLRTPKLFYEHYKTARKTCSVFQSLKFAYYLSTIFLEIAGKKHELSSKGKQL